MREGNVKWKTMERSCSDDRSNRRDDSGKARSIAEKVEKRWIVEENG